MPDRSNASSPPRVIIVGGGFSGTMTAVHLLRTGKPVAITIFDSSKRIARGIAYSATSPRLLLNVPAAKMSPLPDEPSAFLDWAATQTSDPILKGKKVTPGTFLPRGLYGSFIEHLLKSARAANPNARVDVVYEPLNNLERGDNSWVARGASNVPVLGDAVVLALGNPWSALPNELKKISTRYRVDPWTGLEFDGIEFGKSVICLGSGLTAVDVVVRLNELGFRGTIHCCSRHGLWPLSHLEDPLTAARTPLTPEGGLREMLRSVRRQIKEGVSRGEAWQPMFDSFRPQHQKLWRSLSLTERERFLRHFGTYWDVHRHRIAPEIARVIEKFRNDGRLVMHAGAVEQAVEIPAGVQFKIRKRHTGEFEQVSGSHVFLCAGAARRISAWRNPLVDSLLQQRHVVADDLKIGFSVSDEASQRGLYALGTPLRGSLWEITAVRELAIQAQETARSILERI